MEIVNCALICSQDVWNVTLLNALNATWLNITKKMVYVFVFLAKLFQVFVFKLLAVQQLFSNQMVPQFAHNAIRQIFWQIPWAIGVSVVKESLLV